MLRRVALAITVALLAAAPAAAQQGPRDRPTRALIATAMEDYQNLEIDRAAERLQVALRGCSTDACSPQVFARVHMSIGIVAVGGQQDAAAGVEAMTRALQADPNVEPDPLMVTPEIAAAFRDAQARTRRGGPRGGGARAPREAAELLHTPASEQLENTPLPVYVEGSGGLSAERVYVYFRGNGMRAFERREMTRVANGWGTEIPCANIIQGNVEYYVQAQDASGAPLASAGSEGSPVQVSIVTRRTEPAPALPGRMPPETCAGGTDECPPGMTGPQCRPRGGARRGGLGDACASNSDCGEGLRCDAGACAAGDPVEGGGDGGESPADPRADRMPRFAMDVGVGLGAVYIPGGRPSYAQYRQWDYVTTGADGSPQRLREYSCGDVICAPTADPGFSAVGYVAAVIRGNLSRRWGLGLAARVQWDSSGWTVPPPRADPVTGPHPPTTSSSVLFANLLINARLYGVITPRGWTSQGLVVAAFGGGGFGQIQTRLALPATVTKPSAHVLSGFGNIVAGVRVEYGVHRNVHLGAEVALQFMLPTFVFAVDVTPFVGFHL